MSLFIYLTVYVLALLALTFFVSRKETEEDFLIAGRNRKWWEILFSKYAAAIGAAWFVVYTGFSYQYGIGVFALLLGIPVGYLLFALWGVPRIRAIAEGKHFFTQGDLVEEVTGSSYARIATNVLAIVGLGLWLSVAIVGGAKLIEYLGLLSYPAAVLITVVVVFSYLIAGGFKAVIVTDIFQGAILFVLLLAVSAGMFAGTGGESLNLSGTTELTFAGVVGFLLIGALLPFAAPDRYQLAYAARDAAAGKIGMALAFVPAMLTALLLFGIGVSMLTRNASLDPAVVFPEALTTFLPGVWVPVGVLLFFVALMSSADTNVYGMVAHALLRRGSTRMRGKVRIGLAVLAAISLGAALVARDILDLSILAAAVNFVVAIPLIYLLAGGKSSIVFMGTVAGGLLGVTAGLTFVGLVPEAGGIAVGGALLGLVATYFWQKLLN